MQTGEVGRQFRSELKDFAARRVLDRQYMGMERLSAKGRQAPLVPPAATARLWCGSRCRRPRRPAADGRSRPDGPGSGGFGRFPAGRAGGSPPAAPRPSALPARRGPAAAVALQHLPMGDGLAAALAHRHAVAGLRMAVDRPVDGAVRPLRRAPDEGQIAALERLAARGRDRRIARPAPRWARSFFATTMSPVVSLSSRCTMPGRRSPPMPDRLSPQWAISALTSVPVQWPAAGCTTRFGGLSMTMMSSSS